jgi:hypothetical protein
MTKLFSKYFAGLVLFSVLIAGCGGGGGSAGTPNGSAGTPNGMQPVVNPGAGGQPAPITPPAAVPAAIEVLTSALTVPSAGGDVEITAFVKNAANVGIAGAPVTFSASSGTLLMPSAVTDAQGAATARLTAGSNKAIRDIKVDVSSGSVSGTVSVQIAGTQITISGSGTLQSGGAATQYVVRAADSGGGAISGAAVSVGSSLGNGLSNTTLTTDVTGSASFLYTPNRAGIDTITVSSLGVQATSTVSVSSVDFVAVSPGANTDIAIGSNQLVRVQYRNGGSGVAGQTVTFSTSRGVFSVSTATTDADGVASANLSSTTAGPAVVVAQIPNVGSVNLPVQFVATTPSRVVVQASPGAVSPNASGRVTNQSNIEAVVRDANGNAVANRQVNFTLIQDLSNGTLSPGTATTDANGRAQVRFIPGASATESNGVVIEATVASTAVKARTSLTVNGQALFISIGFGNTISNVDDSTYSKDFSVYVTDSNGVAVGNSQISLSVIPTRYLKGRLALVGTRYDYATPPAVCANEDINLNGTLDVGEDINRNGLLTPGNIVVAAPGQLTTDAAGRGNFAIQYGEQFAPWATVGITARATVAGTESRNTISFDLVGSSADFAGDTPPAGVVSPFGTSADCTIPN